jgi:hypothetical protein
MATSDRAHASNHHRRPDAHRCAADLAAQLQLGSGYFPSAGLGTVLVAAPNFK